MRTLSKPQKPKPAQQTNPKDAGERKDNKQSKKVMKTVFHSPFRYKMYNQYY
jgi:hypothetical protein